MILRVVERDDLMYNDFEYLYMVRTQDSDSLNFMLEKFNKLIWKRAHTYFNQRRPVGISVEDLYQEGSLGLVNALYSYNESMSVGLAYYIQLCVESTMKSIIRKSKGKSFSLLNPDHSLDMTISEDNALFLHDVVADESFRSSPTKMSQYYYALEVEKSVIDSLSKTEAFIYIMREKGHSYKDISLYVQLSEKNVDNILQKIKRKINRLANETC